MRGVTLQEATALHTVAKEGTSGDFYDSLCDLFEKVWDEGAFDASLSLNHGGHNANNPYSEDTN